MKHQRVEVVPVGPADRSGLLVDPHPCEELWISKGLGHRPTKVRRHVRLGNEAVAEGQLEHVPGLGFYGYDARNHVHILRQGFDGTLRTDAGPHLAPEGTDTREGRLEIRAGVLPDDFPLLDEPISLPDEADHFAPTERPHGCAGVPHAGRRLAGRALGRARGVCFVIAGDHGRRRIRAVRRVSQRSPPPLARSGARSAR